MEDMMEDLISAFDVACVMGYSTETIIRRARAGRIPGAVFLGRSVRFIPSAVEAFIRSGGEPQTMARPPEPRFRITRHGGKSHAAIATRGPGGLRQVTVDAEYTVKRNSAEGDRKPGQGPTGFEPRFLGGGRNVMDDYPWPNTSPASAKETPAGD
jgi:predicted DNA-binding transcriptional regulator AlpA